MKFISISRTTVIGSIFSLVGVLILGQLLRINIGVGGRHLSEEGYRKYEYRLERIYPERGYIYDRWGHLLAGNKEVYEVGLNLAGVSNPETIARELENILGLNYGDVLRQASRQYEQGVAEYIVLVNFVEPSDIAHLEELRIEYWNAPPPTKKGEKRPSLNGLTWRPHLQRTYPENDLGSNIIGFYSFRDQVRGKSYYGVEEKYDEVLSGTAIEVMVPVNPNMIEELPTAPPGASVILTIDREIQATLEEIVDRAKSKNGAASTTALVMNPKTGEILAMATNPRMDLNKYWDLPEIYQGSIPFNRVVGQSFEPGSVFKVITMAAALDTGTVAPSTPFLDTGVITIGGVNIYNWDRSAWGPQTMVGCMQHSLNVCLVWVAQQVGTKSFYEYLESFGVGQRTNIDLGGEVNFPLSTPGDENWWEVNLGTNSFGQGVSMTPIQFTTAISAIANEGKMMAPHVLKSVIDNDRQYDYTPQVIGNPISRETARTLTDMLSISLEEEASDALIPGYRVAGKTGTAEIAGPYGYNTNQTNAAFVGWGPVDDPQFVVFVWLERPTSSPWGSIVAAPVFSEIVQELVVYMDIPPDGIRMSLKD